MQETFKFSLLSLLINWCILAEKKVIYLKEKT